MDVSKFTLATGKVIYLREPVIDDTEKAAQIAGKKAGNENNAHLMILVQKEMLKLLLVKIDDTDLKLTDKENLQKLLTVKEYNQAVKAMNMLVGDDSGNDLVQEFTTIGAR